MSSYHITTLNSTFVTSGYAWNLSPFGTVLVDAAAFLIASPTAQDSMSLDSTGSWNVTVNGEVLAEGFHAGIVLGGGNPFAISTITIGTQGEVAGSYAGIFANGLVNINNSGTIGAGVPSSGLVEVAIGNYTINNTATGLISGFGKGIEIFGDGTHTISNAGTVSGELGYAIYVSALNSIEKVTNSGTFVGNVFLGAGDDVFTNLGKVTGTIDLGDGNDKFTGGNNAEVVKDGNGFDTINLGGGNDTYIATGNTGADGNDIIDGGAGIDTYDASAAAAFIWIDLGALPQTGPFNAAVGDGNDIGIAGATFDAIFNFENVKLGPGAGLAYGTNAANVLDASAELTDTSILFGEGGNDTLIGGNATNGIGSDILNGGAGKDLLTGGGNADSFYYSARSDSGATAATRDVITDFSGFGHEGDSIHLAFDADTLHAGNQLFQFTSLTVTGDGLGAFTGQAGELRYVPSAQGAILYGDTNGDKVADFSIDVHMQGGQHAFDTAGHDVSQSASTIAPSSAAVSYHITTANSRLVTSGYAWALSPANTVIVDAAAFLVGSLTAQDSMFLDNSGAWNVTVNGEVLAEAVHAGIVLDVGNAAISTITIGSQGEVAGGYAGIFANSLVNINNAGTIASTFASSALVEVATGNYTINNTATGLISGVSKGIEIFGDGTHTISNAGTVSGGAGYAIYVNALNSIEKVTNSGTFVGNVFLGGGDDVFTNLGKVTGTIDLGDGNDKFTGGNNAEVVKDGNGFDTINLGGGNDTYIATGNTGADGNDIINGGAGIDTYDASAAAGTSVNINLDTVMHSSLAASTASGGDIGSGFMTHDTLTGFENVKLGSGGSVWGTSAANVLDLSTAGSSSNLHGLGGNDTLIAGGASDTLDGGAGKDTLTGGAANDIFLYNARSDSGTTAATRDVITDFSGFGGQGDRIELLFDADTLHAGNQAFQFTTGSNPAGQNPFTGHAGELRYVASAQGAILYADTNGDKVADFSIDVHMQGGQHTFDTTHDFIFIV